MDSFTRINTAINNFIWGPVMLVLLVGTGLYLTIRIKGFTIRKLGYVFKKTLFTLFDKDKDEEEGEGEITAFQALATALAATVGTGNIAGVAGAIAVGGPGSIFWMWLSAIFGMATKFSEVVLSIEYREKSADGRYLGGPMYYIKNGLNSNFLSITFAVFASLAAFGIGNMVQANSMSESLASFGVKTSTTGIVLAILVSLVMLGGLKRIASLTEKLVPFMAIFYIAGGLAILILNFKRLPAALALIFKSAFSKTAARGGFAGASIKLAMRNGMARGVFSNEAGLGSAPIAHAAAKTDHPVSQGLWGIFEVFADTIVICSITALTIILSGVWDSGESGVSLTTMAFQKGLPGPGGMIVSLGIMLFAFSTLLSWSYYGERSIEFLFGESAIKYYRMVWIPAIYIGAVGGLEIVWDVADTLNGLMAIPNLIAIIGLSGVVIDLTKDYFKRENLKL